MFKINQFRSNKCFPLKETQVNLSLVFSIFLTLANEVKHRPKWGTIHLLKTKKHFPVLILYREKCLEGRKKLKETANLLNSPKCPQRSESKQKQVKCQKLNFLKANKHNRLKKKNPERKRAYGLNLGSSCFTSIQVTPLEHPHFSTITVDAKVQFSPPREWVCSGANAEWPWSRNTDSSTLNPVFQCCKW